MLSCHAAWAWEKMARMGAYLSHSWLATGVYSTAIVLFTLTGTAAHSVRASLGKVNKGRNTDV